MRLGAKVPNSGPLAEQRGIAEMAVELEVAGFESLWVSDHVVMPTSIDSLYPFAADGKATWPTDTPYFDAMTSLAVIATATSTAVLGTAVLVLPLRNPVMVAKQAASIDVLSGGRLALGIGAGWLREEFEALDVPFETRGRRFVEWITLLRSCWTGRPEEFVGEHYHLPAGVLCQPPPSHEIPLLIGGHSKIARTRVTTMGSGWLAQHTAGEIKVSELEADMIEMKDLLSAQSRDRDSLWVTLRLVDSVRYLDEVVEVLPTLRDLGVNEIIVDTDWSKADSATEAYSRLDAARRR